MRPREGLSRFRVPTRDRGRRARTRSRYPQTISALGCEAALRDCFRKVRLFQILSSAAAVDFTLAVSMIINGFAKRPPYEEGHRPLGDVFFRDVMQNGAGQKRIVHNHGSLTRASESWEPSPQVNEHPRVEGAKEGQGRKTEERRRPHLISPLPPRAYKAAYLYRLAPDQ